MDAVLPPKIRCCFVPNSTLSCLECKVIRYPQLVVGAIYMRELTKIRQPKLGHECALYIYKPSFKECSEKIVCNGPTASQK